MKRTLFQRFISIFGLSFLTVLFLTCNDPLQDKEQQKAKVTFTVNAARTVLPGVSLTDVARYQLLGTRDGATETELAASFTAAGASVELEPGTWNFTLNVFNDSNDIILRGEVNNKQISLTEINQVHFSLSVIKSGKGSIQITINFPVIAGITQIGVVRHEVV